MFKKLKNFVDITFFKFVIVGIVNTVFGTTVMFIAYNFLHLSYWLSSASNYILGSILSYFLNKHFTFQNKSKSPKTVFKFILNISICYLLAYGIAKPFIRFILASQSKAMQENVAMFIGMCLFMVLNYFGQRFFAFKETD